MTGSKNTPNSATQLIVEGAHVEKKPHLARTGGGGGTSDNLFFDICFLKTNAHIRVNGRKPNKIKGAPCLDTTRPK